MKISRFVVTTAVLLLALTGSYMTVSAQQTDAEKEAAHVKLARQKAELEGQLQAKTYTVLGTKMGFETKLVKGAPYSAIAVTETVQTLSDGNRITQRSSTNVYRDSAGRTRRETLLKDGQPQAIVLSDPTTGVNYTLDPKNRSAQRHESAVRLKLETVAREVEGVRLKLDAEKKQALAENPADTLPRKKLIAAPAPESLGRQLIEGIEAAGTRTTTTIPAGQIGNDLPLNIVSEQWYSPELQLLLMTKHSDPRTGETIYRLTNILRAEPDRTLFEVPADYAMHSEIELKRLQEKLELEKRVQGKRKPEEQP